MKSLAVSSPYSYLLSMILPALGINYKMEFIAAISCLFLLISAGTAGLCDFNLFDASQDSCSNREIRAFNADLYS